MTVSLRGPLPGSWKCTRNEQGYRDYEIKHLVACSTLDGPANALQCPGLPLPGSLWAFQDDIDVWAWCKLDAEVDPKTSDDQGEFFVVTNHFTTQGTNKRCCVEPVDDPLLEPVRISGNSVKFTQEGVYDRHGKRILNSAYEQLRGPQNEWDNNRHMVKVEQNVNDLEFDLCNEMVNTVNEDELWGLEARKVKLANFTWDKKFRGDCEPYYVRTFEFEINFDGWDRDLVDEGTKVLNGYWYTDGKYYRQSYRSTDNSTLNPAYDFDGNVLDPDPDLPLDPDPANPAHFIRFQDKNGNQARVILDGHGLPYDPDEAAETHWWAFSSRVEGVADIFLELTCSVAVDLSIATGGLILGPYNSREEAEAAAIEANATEVTTGEVIWLDPEEVVCDEVSSPGKIHVEYYDESDFLLLDIPTEL